MPYKMLLIPLILLSAVPSAGQCIEEEVRIPVAGGIDLAGTLALPESTAPVPAVVMMSGGFPDDRDATAYGFKPFRILAEHLCSRGIASLRYDDRGVGGSGGDFLATPLNVLVDDVAAAVAFLSRRSDIQSRGIGFLGHSMGAIAAPAVGVRDDRVAFLIGLSGTALPGSVINLNLRKRALGGEGLSSGELARRLELEERAIEVIASGEGRDRLVAAMRSVAEDDFAALPAERRARYTNFDSYYSVTWYGLMEPFIGTTMMQSFYGYDPMPDLERTTAPALFLFGGNDGQCRIQDAAPKIADAFAIAGNHDYALRVFPRAGHYLTVQGRPGFAPGVLEAVSEWVLEHTLSSAGTSALQDHRFTETWVPVDESLRLYSRVVGTGPDTVVVPAGMYLAREFLPLVPGRTLIFYDLRNRGASDVVAPEKLGIEFDVADLEAVRSHFGLGRFSLIGWSYLGAMVALYAAEHPAYVERVIQIGPLAPRSATAAAAPDRSRTVDRGDLEHLARLREAGVPESDPVGYCREWLTRQLLPSMMGRPENVANARMDPCLYRNEWPGPVMETLSRILPPSWDYSDRAQRLQAPVLIIHGTADPSAPIEGGREWASRVPDAQLVELEGVGHVPFLEAPGRFFQEVDAFLSADRASATDTGFAEVNDTRLYYEATGAGEPVVLIHGWSFDLRNWEPQIEALAREHRVLAYDLRGFGRSALPEPGVAYSHTEDLVALMDHLGVGSAHVLGHSFGGRIAIDLALRYPERVRSLILPDAATDLVDAPMSDELRAWIGDTWRIGREEGVEAAKRVWLAGSPLAPSLANPRAAATVRRMVADYSGWHWRNRDPYVGITSYPRDRLEEIAAPTLVMVGGANPWPYHETARIQHERIPDARLATIPDVGHALNLENPEAFNAAVVEFLRAVTSDATGAVYGWERADVALLLRSNLNRRLQ